MSEILNGLLEIPNSFLAVTELKQRLRSRMSDRELFGDDQVGPATFHLRNLPESCAAMRFIDEMEKDRWREQKQSYIDYCRAFCGDESIVERCLITTPGRGGGWQTMSLCSLGTSEAVEALRKLVRVTEYPRLARAAAYALAWHHVDDGIDVMLQEFSQLPAEERLAPAVFLATCHHRQACGFLKDALSHGLEPMWPVSRILLFAEMNVKRCRPTGTLQREEMLAWLDRMNAG